MKKLIFCCLVVLMGSCKDKDKDVEPDVDYSTEFVGSYWTTTIMAGQVANQTWEVVSTDKNKLAITYTKDYKVSVGGSEISFEQKYELVNVVPTSKESFNINEEVDVTQSDGKPLRHKVEGVGTKVINAAGVPQINITLKLTNASTGATASEEYLEFKKK